MLAPPAPAPPPPAPPETVPELFNETPFDSTEIAAPPAPPSPPAPTPPALPEFPGLPVPPYPVAFTVVIPAGAVKVPEELKV